MASQPDILSRLRSEDPVIRYVACEELTPEHDNIPGLRERLMEMLTDDTDWDCENYICANALEGLKRLDPTGGSWLEDVIPAICTVDKRERNATKYMTALVREISSPELYIAWTKKFLPRPHEIEDHSTWAESALERAGLHIVAWHGDVDLVDAMLALGGEDRLDTLAEIVFWDDMNREQEVSLHMEEEGRARMRARAKSMPEMESDRLLRLSREYHDAERARIDRLLALVTPEEIAQARSRMEHQLVARRTL